MRISAFDVFILEQCAFYQNRVRCLFFWGGRQRPAVDWSTATGLFKVLVAKSLIAGFRERGSMRRSVRILVPFLIFCFYETEKANYNNYGIKESRHLLRPEGQ